jgi:hypothetical protein
MVYMVERIEERVRNMVGPFYHMAAMLKNIDDNKINNYLHDNHERIANTMRKSIEYLIDMAHIIDDHLPDGFDINELLDKRKYQLDETKETEN